MKCWNHLEDPIIIGAFIWPMYTDEMLNSKNEEIELLMDRLEKSETQMRDSCSFTVVLIQVIRAHIEVRPVTVTTTHNRIIDDVLCYDVICNDVLCYDVLCNDVLCYDVLCYALK